MIEPHASCKSPLCQKSELRYRELVELPKLGLAAHAQNKTFVKRLGGGSTVPLWERAAWCLKVDGSKRLVWVYQDSRPCPHEGSRQVHTRMPKIVKLAYSRTATTCPMNQDAGWWGRARRAEALVGCCTKHVVKAGPSTTFWLMCQENCIHELDFHFHSQL